MVLGQQTNVSPALEARDLYVLRGKRDVVHGVSLDVHAGSVVALIGPNGSGKTTLLKALAGLIPSRGFLAVQGQSLQTLDRRQRAHLVAYVPQQSLLDAPLSVHDVVAQGRLARTPALGRASSLDRAAIEESMEATDVTQFAGRPFTSLSHGERHRVLIARGLATQAPVVLLDEPTAGLDLEHVMSLQKILLGLAKAGCAILVVLHPLAEVQSIAERVAVLAGGKMVAFGREPEVLTTKLVRDVYKVNAIPGGAWGFRAATSGEMLQESSASRVVPENLHASSRQVDESRSLTNPPFSDEER